MITVNEQNPGQRVEKIAGAKDYTRGRRGEIVEINLRTSRARVRWLAERDGSPLGKNLRTWNGFKYLRAVKDLE